MGNFIVRSEKWQTYQEATMIQSPEYWKYVSAQGLDSQIVPVHRK